MFDKFSSWEFPALAVLLLFIARFFRDRKYSQRRLRLPPGPRGWPIVGALPLLGNKPNQSLAKLAERYGPVMYLKMGTTGMVVASTPHAARTFLKDLNSSFSNRPQTLAARVTYDAQDIVFQVCGTRWKLMRKLVSLHLFGGKATEQWTGVREQEVQHMLKDMCDLSSRGKPVAVAEILSCTLANIIGQMVLSKRMFELEKSRSSRQFKELVVEMLRYAGQFNIGDYISYVDWMDLQGLGAKLRRLHDMFDELLDVIIAEHTSTADQRRDKPDFLDMLMTDKANWSDDKLSLVSIKALLEDLFVAGTDTTSSSIEWALTELLRHPSILARAREEIDHVIDRDRLVYESDLPKLPYIQAICKESLRLHPPTPLIPRLASDNVQVDGYDIPRGTTLIVNLWAIGRDPETWESPTEFMPERFMNANEKGSIRSSISPMGNDFELIPFGAGRRICAGMRLGRVSIEYILATLVHAFEWNLPGMVSADELNIDDAFGLTLQKAIPLSTTVKPRLSPSAYV